jgi:CDP-glycerol glycerophosphotransferase (TagB/SpsB family)
MGQPSLETWHRLESNLSPGALYKRLHIPSGKQLLVFAGQYGEGYEEILEAFLKVAKDELNRREDLYIVLSPHPKTGGVDERAALLKHAHQRFIVAPPGVTTAEIAAASEAVITWRSTVGIQAAFLGKPVIYFNFNARDYQNDLIEQGIAQAATPATFSTALRTALTRRGTASDNRRRLSELGYVINSDRKIATEVIRLTTKHK